MRITLEFGSIDEKLNFPIRYNYYIQSFLYRHISPELVNSSMIVVTGIF